MRPYAFVLFALTLSCDGSSPSTNNGGNSTPQDLRCEEDQNCIDLGLGTDFCIDERCQQCDSNAGSCVPSCDANTPCETGFHCSEDQCLPNCETDADCCRHDQDNCDLYSCLSNGDCLLTERVTDCPECPDPTWQCSTTLQCSLRDVCNLNSDCSPGLICVDVCINCTSSEQCPSGQSCQSGTCQDACADNGDCSGGQICQAGTCQTSGSPGTAVNHTCTNNADCGDTGVDGAVCSQTSGRCTKSCSNNGQCRSDGYDRCESGECVGVNN